MCTKLQNLQNIENIIIEKKKNETPTLHFDHECISKYLHECISVAAKNYLHIVDDSTSTFSCYFCYY